MDISDWQFHLPKAFAQEFHHEVRVDLQKALLALPDVFRNTVVLRSVFGFSVNEIAAMEGVAPGTIKSRYARGRKLLQNSLGRAGYGS